MPNSYKTLDDPNLITRSPTRRTQGNVAGAKKMADVEIIKPSTSDGASASGCCVGGDGDGDPSAIGVGSLNGCNPHISIKYALIAASAT